MQMKDRRLMVKNGETKGGTNSSKEKGKAGIERKEMYLMIGSPEVRSLHNHQHSQKHPWDLLLNLL